MKSQTLFYAFIEFNSVIYYVFLQAFVEDFEIKPDF